ncbi:hypothetical protein J3R30DRAFT_844436 [Lentinula aciculospora]|uniref:Transmembrane protein n=1 Tax=Lentinula aciculospora TaxID=153920 RepID=A0A9W9DWR1_9AGAR|nr:hypothetical protein J3R30DRAFT_844436 [Lentinula aciculospora]
MENNSGLLLSPCRILGRCDQYFNHTLVLISEVHPLTLTMSWNVVVSLLSTLALSSSSRGQTTSASCTRSFSWADNSFQQSPCLVAALLESLCDPFGVQIPALPASNHYTGPSSDQATTCECSTVTYMLISACGACQNRDWIPWQNWSQNCPTIELSIFPVPVPATIDVPLWTYMNISMINGIFNVEVAQNNATLSQSTSDSASSFTSLQTSSTFISLSTSVPLPVTTVNANSTPPNSQNHGGAIAGGVVGGLTLLVALALFILWFGVKHKRKVAELSKVPVQTQVTSPEMKANGNNLNASMSTVPTPYTYATPSSGATSSIYTTFGYDLSLITGPHTTFSQTRPHGGPEI